MSVESSLEPLPVIQHLSKVNSQKQSHRGDRSQASLRPSQEISQSSKGANATGELLNPRRHSQSVKHQHHSHTIKKRQGSGFGSIEEEALPKKDIYKKEKNQVDQLNKINRQITLFRQKGFGLGAINTAGSPIGHGGSRFQSGLHNQSKSIVHKGTKTPLQTHGKSKTKRRTSISQLDDYDLFDNKYNFSIGPKKAEQVSSGGSPELDTRKKQSSSSSKPKLQRAVTHNSVQPVPPNKSPDPSSSLIAIQENTFMLIKEEKKEEIGDPPVSPDRLKKTPLIQSAIRGFKNLIKKRTDDSATEKANETYSIKSQEEVMFSDTDSNPPLGLIQQQQVKKSIIGFSSDGSPKKAGRGEARVADMVSTYSHQPGVLQKDNIHSSGSARVQMTKSERKSKMFLDKANEMIKLKQQKKAKEQPPEGTPLSNKEHIENIDSDTQQLRQVGEMKDENKLSKDSINFFIANKDETNHKRKCCLFYPEDQWKTHWDLFVTGILMFTCFVTPYRIAFIDEDNQNWQITNNVIDSLFFLDILIIFNSAYYNEDFQLIEDRKVIANTYLEGWFAIDLLAIVPFDYILGGEDLNEIVRITRIGRMYKLVKLTRLLRVLKIVKERSKLVKYVQEILKIGIGFERLIIFIFSLLIMCHIVCCLWVMTTQLEDENTETWMTDGADQLSPSNQYLTSFYFTITTITTVGYGDVDIRTPLEKIFCIIIMLVGVISFSFASGSLASILQNYDSQNAKFKEQIMILNRMYKEYQLPLDLYVSLKKSLSFRNSNEMEEMHSFLEELPHKLKIDISVYLYEKTYKSIRFLQEKSSSFIAWICPLLKPYIVTENQYVYFEGDEITCIYFVKDGSCGFVLSKHDNCKYIQVNVGSQFGVLDIIGSVLRNEDIELEDWIYFKDKMKRQFTIMADSQSQMLTLSVQDLNRMSFEFLEAYEKIFEDSQSHLQKALFMKLKAMKHCHDQFNQYKNQDITEDELTILKEENYNFKFYDLEELAALNLSDLESDEEIDQQFQQSISSSSNDSSDDQSDESSEQSKSSKKPSENEEERKSHESSSMSSSGSENDGPPKPRVITQRNLSSHLKSSHSCSSRAQGHESPPKIESPEPKSRKSITLKERNLLDSSQSEKRMPIAEFVSKIKQPPSPDPRIRIGPDNLMAQQSPKRKSGDIIGSAHLSSRKQSLRNQATSRSKQSCNDTTKDQLQKSSDILKSRRVHTLKTGNQEPRRQRMSSREPSIGGIPLLSRDEHLMKHPARKSSEANLNKFANDDHTVVKETNKIMEKLKEQIFLNTTSKGEPLKRRLSMMGMRNKMGEHSKSTFSPDKAIPPTASPQKMGDQSLLMSLRQQMSLNQPPKQQQPVVQPSPTAPPLRSFTMYRQRNYIMKRNMQLKVLNGYMKLIDHMKKNNQIIIRKKEEAELKDLEEISSPSRNSSVSQDSPNKHEREATSEERNSPYKKKLARTQLQNSEEKDSVLSSQFNREEIVLNNLNSMLENFKTGLEEKQDLKIETVIEKHFNNLQTKLLSPSSQYSLAARDYQPPTQVEGNILSPPLSPPQTVNQSQQWSLGQPPLTPPSQRLAQQPPTPQLRISETQLAAGGIGTAMTSPTQQPPQVPQPQQPLPSPPSQHQQQQIQPQQQYFPHLQQQHYSNMLPVTIEKSDPLASMESRMIELLASKLTTFEERMENIIERKLEEKLRSHQIQRSTAMS